MQRPNGSKTGQNGQNPAKTAKFRPKPGMVQTEVTIQRRNSVGNGLRPVPLAPERRGGRSLQVRRNVTLTIGKLNHAYN